MFTLQLVFCFFKNSLCSQIYWQGQIMKEVLWNEMQFKIEVETQMDRISPSVKIWKKLKIFCKS